MECTGSSSGAVGGGVEAEMLQETEILQEASQNELFQPRYYSDKRSEVLAEGVGYPRTDNGNDMAWREQSLRRKHETGSVDLEAFSKMSLDQKLIALFTKLSTMESKQNSLSSVMSRVNEKVDMLEDCVNINARKVKTLSYRSLDLEARSRRNNLVFRGLADVLNENCAGMIIDFLSEEMQIQIGPNDIVRAHRLGSLQRRPRYEVTKRPIIVTFKDYSLVELIVGNVRSLWGKNYRVEKDFPAEIAEARKNLWPKLKAEKAKNPTCTLSIGYPAKLIKNDRVIANEFPDWRKVLRTSRVQGSESGESSDENDNGESSSDVTKEKTVRKHVLRPWQPSRSTKQAGYQADTDSDSD